MSMVLTRNATDVRKNFREFIDEVIHERPLAIQRHGDDIVLALSLPQMDALLGSIKFTMEYAQEDDGTISGSLQELPIVENAPDREALRNLMAQSTVEYANLILENYVRYSNSPAIRSELPYIMKIALQTDVEAVRELLCG